MKQKVLYEELVPQEFRERLKAAPIAYLPLGTLEWHGEHLPLGADGIQAQGFFCALAEKAGGIVLPMLFLGPDRIKQVGALELYGMDVDHSSNINHRYPDQQLAGSAYRISNETFKLILDEILKQLSRAGFKIVVGHGHGPSTRFFRDHAQEWKERFNLLTFVCWDESPAAREGYGIQTDHAAANETSLVMALRPDLVQMERLSSDPAQWPLAVNGKDPRVYAHKEIGEEAIALQVKRMATILHAALLNGACAPPEPVDH